MYKREKLREYINPQLFASILGALAWRNELGDLFLSLKNLFLSKK